MRFAICSGDSDLLKELVAATTFFSRVGVEEIVNLQPKGRMAKSYQVAQIRDMILKYRLEEKTNE